MSIILNGKTIRSGSSEQEQLKKGGLIMPKRLTVGMRARFNNKKEGDGSDVWRGHPWKEYQGREALLLERSSNGGFSVMVLGKGVTELKKEQTGIVENQVAWVNEEGLDFINADFDTNLDFIDWYQQHKDDFCGDCLAWRPNQDEPCPNEDCPGRLYDEGLCPYCRTPAPKRARYCKGEINGEKCGFDWQLGN